MRRLYFDNAATSFPKAPGLGGAMAGFIENDCVSIYRTSSVFSQKAFDFVFALRELICGLYNYRHPENVVFTKNVTEALNWLLKGFLHEGDHVITDSFCHNAVTRPLVQIGCEMSFLPHDGHGHTLFDDSLVKKNSRALVVNAVSNVTGIKVDLRACADYASRHGLLFFIDCAQASPFVDIDMSALSASAVAFTAHKWFLGPQGTGGFLLRKDLCSRIDPLISGGTGSFSDSFDIPSVMPDRLSAGTENMVGLAGLYHSLSYVMDNKDDLRRKIIMNARLLYNVLSGINGVKIISPDPQIEETSIVSLISDSFDISMLAAGLMEKGVETRVGLHCAPAACRALNVFPKGVLRFSPGPFNNAEEIESVGDIIRSV